MNAELAHQVALKLTSPEALESSSYALPLKATEEKLAAFRAVVTSPHAQALRPMADKLRHGLPEATDSHTKEEIYAALADGNNPYDGDTIRALYKPNPVYTRISQEQLATRYGPDAARKMGRSWSREMFGRQVVIGEPLVDESGKELELNFEDAKEACIKLNPPEKQEEVRAALKAREEALEKLLKARPADFIEQRANFYRDHPIPGIYLMSIVEWRVVDRDFGTHNNRFFRQILPKLTNRRFWSSTVHPEDPDFGYYFSGDGVGRDYGSRSARNEVRCAATGW